MNHSKIQNIKLIERFVEKSNLRTGTPIDLILPNKNNKIQRVDFNDFYSLQNQITKVMHNSNMTSGYVVLNQNSQNIQIFIFGGGSSA